MMNIMYTKRTWYIHYIEDRADYTLCGLDMQKSAGAVRNAYYDAKLGDESYLEESVRLTGKRVCPHCTLARMKSVDKFKAS